MTTSFHSEVEAKWRRRKKELQSRGVELKSVVQQQQQQIQELQRDDELSSLLFPRGQ